MPVQPDPSFVDRLPRNVAVQLLERVESSGASERSEERRVGKECLL